jgi:hypothetical protein
VADVLVTMRFSEAQLDRLRAVSPDLRVSRADPEMADYSRTDVLYAGAPPRDLAGARREDAGGPGGLAEGAENLID